MAVFRVPVDTYLFNALQLHPRAVLGFSYHAMTATYADAGYRYPMVLRDVRAGFVATRLTIEYVSPLRFADASELEVTSVLGRTPDAKRYLVEIDVAAVGKPVAVHVRMVLAPLQIIEPDALLAKPGPLPDELAAKLTSREVTIDRNAEKVRDIAARIAERAPLLGEHRHAFVIDRTLCEVADQWYYPDIPRLLEPAREALALARAHDTPRLADALVQPLRRFDMELTRPFFWRQEGEVIARAFEHDGRLVVIHQLRSTAPIAEPAGVVIESW